MALLPQHAKIFLVGFMGAGKTTLGRLLAERLKWEFEDLDATIEEQERRPIRRIFEVEGAPRFRALERRALAEACALPHHAVVACGGGCFAAFENQALMRRHGVTVWLDRPFAAIWAQRDELAPGRPLLGSESATRRLYEQRAGSYRLAAVRLPVGEGDQGRALDELAGILRDRYAIP